jgi:hypothetical protein
MLQILTNGIEFDIGSFLPGQASSLVTVFIIDNGGRLECILQILDVGRLRNIEEVGPRQEAKA